MTEIKQPSRRDALRTGSAGILTAVLSIFGPGCSSCREEELFTDTGDYTGGGYKIFQYNGEPASAAEVSERFDAWDESRGDLCRNTGYLNVRGENNETIVAGCRNGTTRTPENYTQVDRSNETVRERISQGRINNDFLDTVEDMCERNDMHAMGLLSVMDFETVRTFRPNIRNPRGTATGLIQFIEPTARSLGTSTSALAQMNQVEQMEYVEAYFQMQKRQHSDADYSNPVDIAMAVFYPAALGNPNHVCGSRTGSRSRRNVYRDNRGLDANHDGIIRAREYAAPALDRGYL